MEITRKEKIMEDDFDPKMRNDDEMDEDFDGILIPGTGKNPPKDDSAVDGDADFESLEALEEEEDKVLDDDIYNDVDLL